MGNGFIFMVMAVIECGARPYGIQMGVDRPKLSARAICGRVVQSVLFRSTSRDGVITLVTTPIRTEKEADTPKTSARDTCGRVVHQVLLRFT